MQGPKGKLDDARCRPGITFKLEDGELLCQPRERRARSSAPSTAWPAPWPATPIKGVTEGFSKELDIVGVGYKAAVEGNKVVFALGYSHPVVYPIPEGIKVAVDAKANRVTVSGIDRQRVGQVAAEIRGLRKPDPYKQKGIRYVGEVLKKKAGKAGRRPERDAEVG